MLRPYTAEQIRQALRTPALQTQLASWPPRRPEVLTALLTAVGATQIPSFTETSAASTQVAAPGAPQVLTTSNNSVTAEPNLFQRHCQQCHSDDSVRLFPLSDIQSLRNSPYRNRIIRRLTNGTMPPPGVLAPTDHERDLMIRMLQEAQ